MRPLSFLILSLIILILPSCGYRLGNYAPNGIQRISIDRVTVGKRCDEPRMGIFAAEKIRTAFVSDGSVTVTGPDSADARLVAMVDSYSIASAGTAKLNSLDPGQEQYLTRIWEVSVRVRYQVVPNGQEPVPQRWQQVEGKTLYSDVLDITTVRQAGIRQALANASRKLVRGALDTDWKAPLPAPTN